MSRFPLVSVVMPTWNRGTLLGEAVASVVGQSFPDWELLVADDGSSDGSVEALSVLAEPRLRILRQPHCGNPARVRNAGAAAAQGQFLAFLDSDDLWLPDKLEDQLAALERSGAQWSYGRAEHIDASGQRIPRRAGRFAPRDGRILYALVAEETAAFIGTLLVERSLFERVGGFDEQLLARHDLDFELRIAAAADAVCIDAVLTLVREHQTRFTRGLADPHLLSARVFERLLARGGDPQVLAAARRRLARLRADAGLLQLPRGQGWGLLARAVLGGDGLHIAKRLVRRIAPR